MCPSQDLNSTHPLVTTVARADTIVAIAHLVVDHRIALSRALSVVIGSLDLNTRPSQQKAHIAARAVWAKFLFLLEF